MTIQPIPYADPTVSLQIAPSRKQIPSNDTCIKQLTPLTAIHSNLHVYHNHHSIHQPNTIRGFSDTSSRDTQLSCHSHIIYHHNDKAHITYTVHGTIDTLFRFNIPTGEMNRNTTHPLSNANHYTSPLHHRDMPLYGPTAQPERH